MSNLFENIENLWAMKTYQPVKSYLGIIVFCTFQNYIFFVDVKVYMNLLILFSFIVKSVLWWHYH